MSPASAHSAQFAAWDRLWAILLAPDDTAGSVRPLGAGVQLQTHNGRVSACQQDDATAEEAERHVLTSTDDSV